MYDYLIAVVLLTKQPVSDDSAFATHSMMMKVKNIAIQWELLDIRESNILMLESHFGADIKTLQRRYQHLRNAPLVADCHRFPPHEMLSQLISFNRDYLSHLNVMSSYHWDKGWYDAARKETEKLYRIYYCLRASQFDYFYTPTRRDFLKEAKQLIGEKDYYGGKLPPVVPIWRFKYID